MTIKTKQKEIKKIPKLRFEGFLGEWNQEKFGDVANFMRGSDLSKNDIVENGKNKCIRYGELYTDYNEIIDEIVSRTNLKTEDSFLSEKDDLIIPTNGETLLDIARVSCVKNSGVILGSGLSIARLKEFQVGSFFAYYLTNYKKKEIAKYGQGVSVVHLYSSHLKNIDLSLPKKEEQQKIAVFLSGVDEWIENLREQKEGLLDYKKGMMQKLFPKKGERVPELRFKRDDGGEFGQWEEQILSNLGKSFNGLSGKSGEDFGKGDPFITYKQIFDSSKIDPGKYAYVKIATNEKQNKTKYGDIFFTTSSETPSEVGFSSVMLNKETTPYLNSFSFGYRPKSLKKLDPDFSRHFFRSAIFRRKVVRLAQGSTRYNISKIGFMNMFVQIPELPEQQKIAEFLTTIDNLIDLKQQQITQAEEWKKGVMQGVFV